MAGRTFCSSENCCVSTSQEKRLAQLDKSLRYGTARALTTPSSKSSSASPIITTVDPSSINVLANHNIVTSAHQPHDCSCTDSAPESIEEKSIEICCIENPFKCRPYPIRPFESAIMSCCGLNSRHESQQATGSGESHSSSGSKSLKDSKQSLTDNPNDDGEHPSWERIILTIEGLKCGCCETAISKAVGRVSSVRNPQINVVLAKIEFDLNTNSCNVEQVIKKLNRATGYTYSEYVQPEGHVLELVVNDPAEICQVVRPYGVTLLEPQLKQAWTPCQVFSGWNCVNSDHVAQVGGAQHGMNVPRRESRAWLPTAMTRFASRIVDPRRKQNTGHRHHQRTIQVHYDAKIIGPRTVLEYYARSAPAQDPQLAAPVAHPSLSIGVKQTKRACLVFLVALSFTLPILIFTWGPVNHEKMIYAHISLGLASIVQIIACWEFVPGSIRSLMRSGLFEMDSLIALSTTAAYVFSVVSYIFRLKKQPLQTDSFFETSTLLVTLILLGRLVGEAARLKAAQSVSFRSLQVQNALLVIPGGSANTPQTRKIDARLLQYGDRFKVVPHTRIVTDGDVKYGGSEVDESMITGESLPVAKASDSPVYAGTNNGRGMLVVELTALAHDNSVSRIAAMVENAELTKPKAQALADRIAGWFVPVVAGIGIVVFFIWLLLGHLYNHDSWQKAVVKATSYAIATLIVSCPCAIGLAVPMVILIASGVSARYGIIFRDPRKLEIARNVTDVVFDKTGTLTTGDFRVCESDIHRGFDSEVIRMLMGLLNGLQHPVSAAVYRWAKQQTSGEASAPLRPTDMQNIISYPGEGVAGSCKESGIEVRVGNPKWLQAEGGMLVSGQTLLCMTVSGILRATFRLQDEPRHTAKLVVKRLQQRGIQVHMISGDNEAATNATAFSLEIQKSCTVHGLRPDSKQEYIEKLQRVGKVVMFVGDGTNDAVALKQADIGVHLNHGSDVAKSAADVVLMNPQLQDVLTLFDIAKAAFRRIVLNFAWSALYNVVAILMASGAFFKVKIAPAYAGLGELVSVLPVVLIAFQMKWRNYGWESRKKEWDAGKNVPS